jgi:hypothetical protein
MWDRQVSIGRPTIICSTPRCLRCAEIDRPKGPAPMTSTSLEAMKRLLHLGCTDGYREVAVCRALVATPTLRPGRLEAIAESAPEGQRGSADVNEMLPHDRTPSKWMLSELSIVPTVRWVCCYAVALAIDARGVLLRFAVLIYSKTFSDQRGIMAAWPRRTPSLSVRFHTVESSIRNRRPDFDTRMPW